MRSANLGTLLLVVGVVAVVTGPLLAGGGTLRACGIESPVYDAIGIYPAEARIVGVDGTTLAWYDGCNWRFNPLGPSAAGAALAVAGTGLRRLG